MMYFFNGLSEEIQDELLPHDLPKDFDELVDMAIRVGTRLSQRRRMRASPGFPLQEFRTSFSLPKDTPTLQYTSEPMQVDRTHLTPAERRQRLQVKACLYCGQMGHFAEACPVKENARQK